MLEKTSTVLEAAELWESSPMLLMELEAMMLTPRMKTKSMMVLIAEEAEEAAAIAATIAASEAQAATEAAADAMMGASVPGVPVGASGDDDEKAADGELSGSSAASRWNPLSYSHFLLRWLLSA